MNIQGWFPLGWLVWFSCSPRDSQESSPAPQFESINSLALSLLYGPTLISVHDYWINHSFDYMDFCQQSDVFAFQYNVKVCHSFSSKEQVSFSFHLLIWKVGGKCDCGTSRSKIMTNFKTVTAETWGAGAVRSRACRPHIHPALELPTSDFTARKEAKLTTVAIRDPRG